MQPPPQPRPQQAQTYWIDTTTTSACDWQAMGARNATNRCLSRNLATCQREAAAVGVCHKQRHDQPHNKTRTRTPAGTDRGIHGSGCCGWGEGTHPCTTCGQPAAHPTCGTRLNLPMQQAASHAACSRHPTHTPGDVCTCAAPYCLPCSCWHCCRSGTAAPGAMQRATSQIRKSLAGCGTVPAASPSVPLQSTATAGTKPCCT
jgi:hypothetical protein